MLEEVGLRIGLRLQRGKRTVGDGAQAIIVAGIGHLQGNAGMRLFEGRADDVVPEVDDIGIRTAVEIDRA